MRPRRVLTSLLLLLLAASPALPYRDGIPTPFAPGLLAEPDGGALADRGPVAPPTGPDGFLLPPLPSTIRLWEAWAKGFATLQVTNFGSSITITNRGPASILLDEYILCMSPSPSNPSEDRPGIDDETQEAALTTTYTIPPGASFDYNYGDYVAMGFASPPPWWCFEDTELTRDGVYITLGGEKVPYEMVPIIVPYDMFTQGWVWNHLRTHAVLVVGKIPLWQIISASGDEVDITLDVTNIGFYDARNVIVTDTIPSGYSYDPSSFTHTPSTIASNPDGSITLKWDIPYMRGAIETPMDDPTIFTTVYIGYKLITPRLDPDIRIFLPRGYVDREGDGRDDAESEEPLLETQNLPPDCDAGFNVIQECDGVQMDASGSDPDGDPVTFLWTSSCSDTTFSPSADVLNPYVTFGTSCDVSCTLTLTVTDDWGAECVDTVLVVVDDNIAPIITGVPGDVTVECDSVPPPASPTATDNCDNDPTLTLVETRTDGSCEDEYVLTRAWTSEDDCGNITTEVQVVTVEDTTPPVLAGVPADETVECDAVPPPATPTATDNCDPAPVITFDEVRIDGDCPYNYTLVRTWTAWDRCGNSSSESQTVTVQDTTPPVVEEGGEDLYCLWPPNHWFVCFDASDFSPVITDNCSDVITWEITDCSSNQDDGGDEPDCVLTDDGQGFCVRAERLGGDPDGRRYAVTIVATDECENSSDPTVIGYIYIPHDQSPHEKECIDTTKEGCKKKDGLPCGRRK